MRISPIVLLLIAMLGCNSGTPPKKPKVIPNSPRAKVAIEARQRRTMKERLARLEKLVLGKDRADLGRPVRFQKQED